MLALPLTCNPSSTYKNIPLLMRYAKAFSIEKIIRQYLGVLWKN